MERAAIPLNNTVAGCEFATIRERLIKIGARVIEHIARIRIQLRPAVQRVRCSELSRSASQSIKLTCGYVGDALALSTYPQAGARRTQDRGVSSAHSRGDDLSVWH